jgi:DNA-binding MarR family transcriptional regulator
MPTRSAPAPRPSYLIGRLHRVLRHALDERVRAHGLTAGQYAALSILGDQPGLSNAQLARRSFMTPQSANQTMHTLQDLGLVRREQDPAHARIARAELTARGRKVLAACDRAVDEVERTMLRELGRQGRGRLLSDLRACLQALDRDYRG